MLDRMAKSDEPVVNLDKATYAGKQKTWPSCRATEASASWWMPCGRRTARAPCALRG